MMRRIGIISALAAVAVLYAPAAQAQCLTHSPNLETTEAGGVKRQVIYQEFPAGGPKQTAWKVAYRIDPDNTRRSFFIHQAHFQHSPNAPWVQVLGESGLSEILVPYAVGGPRFRDLLTFSKAGVHKVGEADAGPCGRLLNREGKEEGERQVVREVRDTGPLWKDQRRTSDSKVVRGQELVLWASQDAENYSYLISYAFLGDGTVKFRVAGTARNLPSAPNMTHVHSAIWRIDVDLNGAADDTVHAFRHESHGNQAHATNHIEPLRQETFLDWNAREFSELWVRDKALKNVHGKPTSYDLKPLMPGIARHIEPYAHHDFWVTRYKGPELLEHFATCPGSAGSQQPREGCLAKYVADQESIENANIVLWHMTPLLHVPRHEDGYCRGGMGDTCSGGIWVGEALAMWGGFDLRPRDLFDSSPFCEDCKYDNRRLQ